MKFHTIESWASKLGFVVEKKESCEGYVWFRENDCKFYYSNNKNELIEEILQEIKNAYVGS